MRNPLFIALFGLCLLLLVQCTIQKRVYRKGWYLSFKKEWRNPGKEEQSREFIVDEQPHEAADLATISDVPFSESEPATASFNDSFPQHVDEVRETPVRIVVPTMENEDTIFRKTDDDIPIHGVSTKAAARPEWVKKLVIFLFLAAIILMIALFITTSPLDLTTSVLVSVIAFAVILLAFLIALVLYSGKKNAPKQQPPQVRKRLLTPEEQLEKKKKRKTNAMVVTIFFGITFILALLMAVALETFVFMLPLGIVFAFFIVIAWKEYQRDRPIEWVKEKVLPEKQYRLKTAEEKQEELKQHKRRSMVSALFWLAILIFVLLISLSFGTGTFFWISVGVCLLFILITCLEYFRWKPKDTVELEPVQEEEPVIDVSEPEEDEPVSQKPPKTPEEQRRSARNRNIVIGLFFAFIAAFFIIGANN